LAYLLFFAKNWFWIVSELALFAQGMVRDCSGGIFAYGLFWAVVGLAITAYILIEAIRKRL
jgi:hypothetical protein